MTFLDYHNRKWRRRMAFYERKGYLTYQACNETSDGLARWFRFLRLVEWELSSWNGKDRDSGAA